MKFYLFFFTKMLMPFSKQMKMFGNTLLPDYYWIKTEGRSSKIAKRPRYCMASSCYQDCQILNPNRNVYFYTNITIQAAFRESLWLSRLERRLRACIVRNGAGSSAALFITFIITIYLELYEFALLFYLLFLPAH